ASLELFDRNDVLDHVAASEQLIRERLDVLRDPDQFPHVVDVRQRGVMVGIALGAKRDGQAVLDYDQPLGRRVCQELLERGVWMRPLGNVLIINPAPAMDHQTLGRMLDQTVEVLSELAI
ncbi:MAG: aminotransferase class III-fold pyridoxal phosphate-dependent enzyme, partial [Phycisphaeraceae bacterium]|nr:aminotransferase class III-fold pyridoxal phosphate-dependent enzyme [Phycisphaeraceae bacterium]